jgi:serine protease
MDLMPGRALAAVALAACTLRLIAWPALSLAADSVLFQHPSIDPLTTDRIIVKWRTSGVAAVQAEPVRARALRLSAANGINVAGGRNLFDQTDLMRLDHIPSHAEMSDILARLNADPGVEYAEPDELRYLAGFPADALPNDPHFVASTDPSNASNPDLNTGSWEGQWYLLPTSATTPSAISATTAWQSTLGLASVVVAVIDTGIIEGHPDFAGKLQAGYDFVSCDQGNFSTPTGGNSIGDCSAGSAATYDFANDGHGWAADAADPGDWINATDAASALFQGVGCTTVDNSSWHGTKVAGIIGALTNNGVGVAGIAPLTTLLPVRVLGKCEARVSDIAAAIRWAAGLGVAVHAGTIAASPIANIINLSLAGNTACSATEQSAISDAIGAGVLVVAAAGNEGGPLDAPANCSGVLSVVGLRHTGTKVPYSNVSSTAAAASIAAPGGNCVNTFAAGSQPTQPCLYGIETTSDTGTTSPASTPGFYTYALLNPSVANSGNRYNLENQYIVGTSFAAPMVAGVAALMLAKTPSLTPAQLIARIQSSALPFPTSSSTSSTSCQLAATTTNANNNYTDTSQNVECVCTTATCGAGMLNANAALLAAAGMFVQISASSTSASPGKHITLDGSGSTAASGRTIVSYQWTTDPATTGQLLNADQAIATLVVPTFRSIQAVLTITDNAGATASASVTIDSTLAASGGGGGMDPWLLWLLAGGAGWQLARRRLLN